MGRACPGDPWASPSGQVSYDFHVHLGCPLYRNPSFGFSEPLLQSSQPVFVRTSVTLRNRAFTFLTSWYSESGSRPFPTDSGRVLKGVPTVPWQDPAVGVVGEELRNVPLRNTEGGGPTLRVGTVGPRIHAPVLP